MRKLLLARFVTFEKSIIAYNLIFLKKEKKRKVKHNKK